MLTRGLVERRHQDGLRILAAVMLIVIGVAVLIGWIWDVFLLTTLVWGYAPVKPISAVGMVAVGIMLLCAAPSRPLPWRLSVSALLAFAIAVLALEQLGEHALGRSTVIDTTLFAAAIARHHQTGQMTVTTAIGFGMIGVGVLAGLSPYPRIGRATAMAAVVLGYGGALGYVYEAKSLYFFGGNSVISPQSALAIFIGGAGVLFVIDSPLVNRLFTDERPGAVLLRRVLPFAVFGLPAIGWVRLLAQRRGLLDLAVGVAVMVISSVALVGLATWRAANDIDALDDERADALDGLLQANAELEARVLQRTVELSRSETGLRDASTALAATNRHLHRLVHDAPIGIMMVNPTNGIIDANPALCELLGVELDDLRGRMLREFLSTDTDYGQQIHQADQLRVGRRDEFVDTVRLRRPDGVEVVVEVVADSSRDERGDVEFILAQIIDVTAREGARVAARLAEAQFRSAFDEAPIGMAIVDAEDRILSINAAFAAIAGYDNEMLTGTSPSSLCHADDAVEAQRAWAGLREHGLAFHAEQRLIRPDGIIVRVSVHASPVDNTTGAASNAIAQIMDISEQHRFQTELAHMAAHDPLTGLCNRRAFEAALQAHTARCHRYSPDGAVLMLDLDNFKRINDTLGHHVGDQLIISAAQTLTSRLRASHVVGRLGGDEFAVLLTRGGPEEAAMVAQHIVDAIRTTTVLIDGQEINVTASVGFAAFDDRQRSADEMLVNADLAMYEAKKDGRDRVAAFSRDHHEAPRV